MSCKGKTLLGVVNKLLKIKLNKKVNALSEKILSHFAAVVEEIACQLGRVTFERKMLEPFLLYA